MAVPRPRSWSLLPSPSVPSPSSYTLFAGEERSGHFGHQGIFSGWKSFTERFLPLRDQSFGILTSNEFMSKGLLGSPPPHSAVSASLALDLRGSVQLQAGSPGTRGCGGGGIRPHRLVVRCGPRLRLLDAGLPHGAYISSVDYRPRQASAPCGVPVGWVLWP